VSLVYQKREGENALLATTTIVFVFGAVVPTIVVCDLTDRNLLNLLHNLRSDDKVCESVNNCVLLSEGGLDEILRKGNGKGKK